jgi:heme/copper-type cytochrome/quinol oxidase subunit 2
MLCSYEAGGAVLQRLFALAMFTITVLWLVVSYMPALQAELPIIAFAGGSWWQSASGALLLVAFIALQVWLLYTTVAAVRTSQTGGNATPFRLKLGGEFFWTVLPILMTVALAWASYALWLNRANF